MKKIKLSRGLDALVDDIDYVTLSQYKWSITEKKGRMYAARKGPRKGRKIDKVKVKTFLMHRVIMNCPEKMSVDHINGNGLDNQRCNLRICTHAENMRNQRLPKDNTSGYKGVTWNKVAKKWYAYITYNYKKKYLGTFVKKEDAYRAYCVASKKIHKEFSHI